MVNIEEEESRKDSRGNREGREGKNEGKVVNVREEEAVEERRNI